ncbi:MAG: tetratricopeptide repeat protein, partial [Okeania sp. SIO3B3]|nr:tetratricopeptide repeat protein [Okeania sp. SIO3B3]
VAHYQGDYEVAQYLFQEAIVLWREMDDQAGLGSGLRNLGQIYYELSQYSDANLVYAESLTFHRAIGDPAGEAMTQHYRGQLLRALGDYGNASMLLEEALAYHQANGDRRNEAHALSHLGLLYSRLDMHDTGLDYLERAIEIMKEMESPWVQAKALTYYGWALGDLERVNDGRIALDGALRLQHSASFLREAAKMETLAHRGRIALIRGDMTLAEACLRPVLAYIREHGTQGIEHPGIIFTTGYKTLTICNRPEEADQAMQEGYAFVTGQAKKISDDQMRESYLHIPEHAEIIVQVEILATG